jgi:hypothetical protein
MIASTFGSSWHRTELHPSDPVEVTRPVEAPVPAVYVRFASSLIRDLLMNYDLGGVIMRLEANSDPFPSL